MYLSDLQPGKIFQVSRECLLQESKAGRSWDRIGRIRTPSMPLAGGLQLPQGLHPFEFQSMNDPKLTDTGGRKLYAKIGILCELFARASYCVWLPFRIV
jgi:hypothetical protein